MHLSFCKLKDFSLINIDLIQDAKKGKPKAQRKIFELMGKPLFMLCLRYVRNQQDAEEVLSIAFTKAFEKISNFDYQGEGSFEAWIKKITVNECLMLLRKQKNAPLIIEPDENMAEQSESALDKLKSQELFELILKLPEGYRTIFNLYEIEGFSHQEIAEKLGISIGTSKSQLSKAKAYLREIIIKLGLNHAS